MIDVENQRSMAQADGNPKERSLRLSHVRLYESTDGIAVTVQLMVANDADLMIQSLRPVHRLTVRSRKCFT